MKAARVLLCLAAGALLARGGSATTVLPLTFDDIVQTANEIFIGEVVDLRSQFVDTQNGRAIVTLVTFRIDEPLKGSRQTQTSIEFLGGTVGDARMEIVAMPQFHVGDRDVVFVGDRNSLSPIVGFMQGRFRIALDPVRGVDTIRTHDGRSIGSVASIGKATAAPTARVQAMTLTEFRAAILARVTPAGGAR